jgi:hypothetical protein
MSTLCLGVVLSPVAGIAADDAVAILSREIQVVERAYSNFALHGTVTRDTVKQDAKAKPLSHSIEFLQLDERHRVTAEPMGSDANTELIVASPDISFRVNRLPDGKEIIRFLSPRRGFGYDSMLLQMQSSVMLCRAPCTFFTYDSLSEMLQEGRLQLKNVPVPADVPERLELQVLLLRPSVLVRGEGSPLDYYTGTMVVLPRRHWCIESLRLKGVNRDGSPGTSVDLVVGYRDDAAEIPVPESVTFIGRYYRYILRVKDIEFGVVKREDFTMAAMGIKTMRLSPGRSVSLPLVYSLSVLVAAAVGIWLIGRWKRRRAA